MFMISNYIRAFSPVSQTRALLYLRLFRTGSAKRWTHSDVEVTGELSWVKGNTSTIPAYQVMDESGVVRKHDQDPNVPRSIALKMYTSMLQMNAMDKILYDAQRQGRISFYMTHYGEEATQIGSAAALHDEDEVFGQYREAGVILWRGFPFPAQFLNQCMSNDLDLGKGRQMPIHYGSRDLHFHTISSPLGTQIPQAAGAAYALKLEGKGRCAIAYFGDGAASEGDFHAALNFASVLSCPVVFFCRNNRWAISTPVHEQYRGDGIAARGPAYDVLSTRIDGNDIWAVYNATKRAREIAVSENRPVLIEAMTYRLSHHSTSDDSTRYRSKEETEKWKRIANPVERLKLYLIAKGWWDPVKESEVLDEARNSIVSTLAKAETRRKPPINDLFTDVYKEMPLNLKRQREELLEHLKKYPDHYHVKFFTDGLDSLTK
mmetsp:Transcript_24945/g.41102  ORF Transcript_24945/g.41102 Transcript_24945/m.41102 type:complete len:433 (-) Transcript_24945:58-1356(-)